MNIFQVVKSNPLISVVILLALTIAIYYSFSTLYAAGEIAVLNHANKQLEKKNTDLTNDRNIIADQVSKRDIKIDKLIEENTKNEALLQSIAQQTVASKKNLDNATATASRIIGDESPLSRDELKQHLCELYNIAPAACQ